MSFRDAKTTVEVSSLRREFKGKKGPVVALGLIVFRLAEQRARREGVLDRKVV